MRRYFITGGTGFIGQALVKEIASRPDTEFITLLTRNAQQRWDFMKMGRVFLYEGDVAERNFPNGWRYTDVIHGACMPLDHDSPKQRENYYAVVEGTRRILDWACRHNPRILLLSSGCACTHETPYCQAKRMSEFLLRCNTSTGKIARIYSVVGDETPTQYAVGLFVRQALMDGKVTVTGGHNAIRSYLHIEDCARWLLRILDAGDGLHPYQVGGGEALTVAALADLVGEVFGVPVEHKPAKAASSDHYVPNTTDSQAIGCKQTITLRQSLERIRDKASLRNPVLQPA